MSPEISERSFEEAIECALLLLKSFVALHPHAIGEKVRILVEHFA